MIKEEVEKILRHVEIVRTILDDGNSGLFVADIDEDSYTINVTSSLGSDIAIDEIQIKLLMKK